MHVILVVAVHENFKNKAIMYVSFCIKNIDYSGETLGF